MPTTLTLNFASRVGPVTGGVTGDGTSFGHAGGFDLGPRGMVQTVANADFEARDTAEVFAFDGRYWLSNGYHHFEDGYRDLWSSPDGYTWTLELAATPYDPYAQMIVFQGKIFAIGESIWVSEDGLNWILQTETTDFGEAPFFPDNPVFQTTAFVLNDRLWIATPDSIWSSADGETWQREADTPFAEPRVHYSLEVHNGQIFMGGGFTYGASDPPEFTYPDLTSHGDLWTSSDGINWTQLYVEAPWGQREWFALHSHGSNLYLFGGFNSIEGVNLNDVWVSSDNGLTWQEIVLEAFTPRHYPSVLSIGDNILIIAGNTNPVVNDIWTWEAPTTHLVNTFNNIERFNLTLGTGNDVILLGAGNDTVAAGQGNDDITGAGGNDSILGNAGADTLMGDEGNDSLFGGSGSDVLLGGDSIDYLVGETGADSLDGGDGADALYGGDENDTISGGNGNDYIDGQGEADLLQGGADRDYLVGNIGNDTLIGGTGNDTLSGGGDNDGLIGGEGNDQLLGGDGQDYLVSEGLVLDFGTDSYNGGADWDSITFNGHGGVLQLASTNVLASIEEITNVTPYGPGFGAGTNAGPTTLTDVQILGTDADDNLDFSSVLLTGIAGGILGGAGNDTIVGSSAQLDRNGQIASSDDLLNGEAGDDLLVGGKGNDTIQGGEGLDISQFDGDIADFLITAYDGPEGRGFSIEDLRDGAVNLGTDILISVKTLRFNDGDVTLNLAPGAISDADVAADSVAENAAAGTVVGYAALSVDPDSDAITYSLSDNPDDLFEIDPLTGVITVAAGAVLDFELASNHTLTVAAFDGVLTTEQVVTVAVTDLDEAPGAISDADAAFDSVAENAAAGTVVGYTALSVDPEGEAITYSLSDNPGDLFEIDPLTGVITVAAGAVLDFEIASTHTLTVAAFDGVLTTEQVITVAVTDLNEAPGDISDVDIAANVVSENAIAGAFTGLRVQSADPENGNVVYSLSNDAGGRFSISADGSVRVANSTLLDFETAPNHQITVRATDISGLFTEQVFALSIGNAGPSLPIDSDMMVNAISENSATGKIVGITAAAADAGGTAVVYSLSNNAGGRFAIDASTGIVSVANGLLLDHESATSHQITVVASDGLLISSQTFTIAVLDVADAVVLNGNDGNDTLVGNSLQMWTINGHGGNDSIVGHAMADQLLGGSGADSLFGEAGNDTLFGGDGNDLVLGGIGSDYLDGQGENDSLYGGDSSDTVVGNIGDDYLDGQGENDELYGNDGRDTLVGNHGNDYLDGGDDRDELYGNDNNDILVGNLGDDYLDGQGETDTLYGGSGNDTLYGNVGNDQIWGGIGTDSLIGGLGDDQFRFALGDLQAGVRDVIADFAEAGGNADLLVFFGVSAGAVTTTAAGGGTLVSIAVAGGTAEILLQGFLPAQLLDQIYFL